jgi:hypothetical protein
VGIPRRPVSCLCNNNASRDCKETPLPLSDGGLSGMALYGCSKKEKFLYSPMIKIQLGGTWRPEWLLKSLFVAYLFETASKLTRKSPGLCKKECRKEEEGLHFIRRTYD